jgi:hypothetical protein
VDRYLRDEKPGRRAKAFPTVCKRMHDDQLRKSKPYHSVAHARTASDANTSAARRQTIAVSFASAGTRRVCMVIAVGLPVSAVAVLLLTFLRLPHFPVRLSLTLPLQLPANPRPVFHELPTQRWPRASPVVPNLTPTPLSPATASALPDTQLRRFVRALSAQALRFSLAFCAASIMSSSEHFPSCRQSLRRSRRSRTACVLWVGRRRS